VKIIKPYVMVPKINTEKVMRKIERCGRVCYQSEPAQSPDSFVAGIIKKGHESVIEHESVTVHFIVDRGISHEIVRHRLASYSQESTRYANYSQDKFGREITVIKPFFFDGNDKGESDWDQGCDDAESAYMYMLDAGRTSQEARSVLSNSTKTELVMTANLREWRHFFKLRADVHAHPQMQQVAIPLLSYFKQSLPIIYADIEYNKNFPAEHYAEVKVMEDW